MNQIIIKDKNNNNYTVEVDPDTFTKESIDNNATKWSVKYDVKDQNGERVGFGSFSANCPMEHEHVTDAQALDGLSRIGAEKVKQDIDNNEPIESKGYNISLEDCCK